MNKSKAINLKCLKCSGDSHKEASLCHLLDCSLWPYRFGYSMRDQRFWKRMEAARRNYREEFKELLQLIPDYLKNLPNTPETAQIHNFYAKMSREGSSALASPETRDEQDISAHSDHRKSLDNGINTEEEK